MAPRKRTSSGGKKSSNPSREPQQSQPSKFGIQHFFERHSQSQKTPSQKRSDGPAADSAAGKNAQIVAKPIANRAELGAGSSGGAASLVKIESRTECNRGVNPRSNLVNAIVNDENGGVSRNAKIKSDVPVVDHIDLCGESSIKRFDDGAVSGNTVGEARNLSKDEVFTRAQAGPADSLLPVVVDDEENPMEVTPETCKSSHVKRFKFSPGMLIKQSQDDAAEEVTWKISPVNERLHAMSKNFPGKIGVLADSTRFNSMIFQECPQEKVENSPNMSGKLEKWLSSPPLKPHKKPLLSSDGLALRKLSRDLDISCPGNHRDSSDKSNTQSPFSTPPSLSCCHEKAVEEVGHLEGVPNQQGSRQHKKALIDLLDQVEDVISVESSSCKDNESHLDAEKDPKADLVVPSSTTNSVESRSTADSNFSFLVLEVSEKQGPPRSSGPPPSFKVLRLLNEQNGAERALQLWDEWFFSVVAPGDTVHVIGEFDSQGKCDINRDKNFLIVHPDILVSGSRVSSSFSCPRRTVLDERIKGTEKSTAALMGTLLHQIFEAGLISESPSKEFLKEYARTVIQKSLDSLYACGVNENDSFRTLVEAIPKILNWISAFRDSQGSKGPTVDFKCDELKKIKICEVIDIEEMAWARRYGLKGKIDASVCVRTNTNSAEASDLIMPLELKTGKSTSGQTAIEHNAQVMLYTLLMSERYMTNIEYGLLYYLHTDQTQGIYVRRSDLVGVIMRRNELANDLLKASTTQQLPPMLKSPDICRRCRHLNVCSIYHKAYGGTAGGSGLGDLYDSLVSHLTTTHTIFLQKWERLIDLEAKHVEVEKKDSWLSDGSRNDHHSNSLSSLVLDNSYKSSERKPSKDNQFIYRFVSRGHPLLDGEQPNRDLNTSSPLEHMFRNGDYVILSTEPDHLRVSDGKIVEISSFHVSVSLGKRLRLPGPSPRSMTEDLCRQSWRIDKDEIMSSFAIMRLNLYQLFLQNESSSCLRKKVVDLEMPRFDSGCIYSQDPAISYVWSEKSLNDDQRRAILKILMAKDYALILGMPGTGKTSTMVHAVKALLLRGASILLTSYTNSAVDNLLIKLKAQGIDFIRIGKCEVVHEDVQENCLSVMNMNSTQEIKEKLERVSVVAVTCLGITNSLLTNKRFDICIMDEAGQITLPASLGPLAFASRFVLVGDHYQLPPLVKSPEAKENGMSVSLFCRLCEAHPHAIAALHSQYRMCAAIMALPNALIYGNRLRCGSTEIENAKLKYRSSASSPAWLMKVLDPNRPVIFINTDMLSAYENNDCKAINPIEAHIIAEAVKTLVLRGIEGQAIGIITPYNSQVNLIRGAVSEPVEIHTIDKYQGRDKDCILVSFVRSSETPRNHSASHLGDWHRINVALTRAKKKLIMVGSCRTLSTVPLLRLMIEKVEELSGMIVVSNKEIKHQLQLKKCSNLI